MSATLTTYEHIVLDENGAPIIAGTRTKVAQLILTQKAYGLSADELGEQLPHLTKGQIYSALAYYWDHKPELDAEIQRRHEKAEQIREELGQAPVVERLRREGFLET